MREQRVREHGRFLLEHVKRGACELAAIESRHDGLLVDDAAARAVEDKRLVLHLGDAFGVDEVGRVLILGDVHGDDVRGRDDFVDGRDELERVVHLGELAWDLAHGLDHRIVADDLHAKADGLLGHDAADVAKADHAKRLARGLVTFEGVAVPLAFTKRERRLRDHAERGEHQRDRLLSGCEGVCRRRVHDRELTSGRGRDVDVVDASACANDELHGRSLLDQLLGECRRRADHDAVVAADHAGELFGGRRLADFDFEIAGGLEDINAFFGQAVGDEDFSLAHECLLLIFRKGSERRTDALAEFNFVTQIVERQLEARDTRRDVELIAVAEV